MMLRIVKDCLQPSISPSFARTRVLLGQQAEDNPSDGSALCSLEERFEQFVLEFIPEDVNRAVFFAG